MRVLAAALVAAGLAGVPAAGAAECESHAAAQAALASPSALPGTGLMVGQAAAVPLKPTPTVTYAISPQRTPGPGSHGAALPVAFPEARAYDVVLTGPAWIDLVQDGRTLDSTDHSELAACPPLRKSVRFNAKKGRAVLQLSGDPDAAIAVLVLPAAR